jgi:hypothetical protein
VQQASDMSAFPFQCMRKSPIASYLTLEVYHRTSHINNCQGSTLGITLVLRTEQMLTFQIGLEISTGCSFLDVIPSQLFAWHCYILLVWGTALSHNNAE